jgi:hypothetical protein
MCKKMKNTLDLLNEIERENKAPEQFERRLAWNAMKVFEGVKVLPQGSISMKKMEDDDICPVALMNMVFVHQDGIKNIVHECPASKEFIRFRVRE